MRCIATVSTVLVLSTTGASLAQAPGVAPAADAPEHAHHKQREAQHAAQQQKLLKRVQQRKAMFIEAGMEPQAAAMLSILTSTDLDPGTVMLVLYALRGRGGGRGMPAIGMLPLLRAFGGRQGEKSPIVFREGRCLYIARDGALYKIDAETMQREDTVEYGKQWKTNSLAPAILLPVFARAREKARQTACLSNVKQLMLATLMYAQDWDEVLPGEQWAEQVFPYIRNEAVFKCPSRPQLKVGYAFNDKLLEANLGNIPNPAETAVLFESNIGGDNPVGNADDIPAGGVHNRGINIGFADGHAKWMPVEQAKELLQRPVFE